MLHPGSRALANLARSFGIETGREHHALDDARTLAGVFLKLESQKQASGPEDQPGLRRSIISPSPWRSAIHREKSEARLFLDLGKLFALGRYSQALESYEAERSRPAAVECARRRRS